MEAPATLPDDAAIAAVPLPTYAAAMAVAYGCCYALAKTCLRQAPCVAVAGDAIFGLVYYPLLFVLALDASFDLYADATLRWTGTTATSVVLGKLLVSRMVVHMPYIFLKRSREEVELRPMYVVHHCIVIVAYGAGVARSLSHFWGAAAALCEATNVFLTVDELLLSAPGVRARPWLAAPQRWLQRGFKAAYVVFRLVLFPCILATMARDVRAMAPADYARLGPFELVVFPAAVLFVFGLSVSWAVTALRPDPRAPPDAPALPVTSPRGHPSGAKTN